MAIDTAHKTEKDQTEPVDQGTDSGVDVQNNEVQQVGRVKPGIVAFVNIRKSSEHSNFFVPFLVRQPPPNMSSHN